MFRQYLAQRARSGDNPLRVGVIAVGSIYYLQDHLGGRPVCRQPWRVEAFLNGVMNAARRNRETGMWEDMVRSGRSNMALVRSLRDARQIRQVAVRSLITHDDLALWKEPTSYPTLPDVERFHPRWAAMASTGRREATDQQQNTRSIQDPRISRWKMTDDARGKTTERHLERPSKGGRKPRAIETARRPHVEAGRLHRATRP